MAVIMSVHGKLPYRCTNLGLEFRLIMATAFKERRSDHEARLKRSPWLPFCFKAQFVSCFVLKEAVLNGRGNSKVTYLSRGNSKIGLGVKRIWEIGWLDRGSCRLTSRLNLLRGV